MPKSVEVSTDVYAAIWARRTAGEETEDQILARIFAVDRSPGRRSADTEEGPTAKVRWRDDVKESLSSLGGSATLSEIYKEVRLRRTAAGRSLPTSLDAIIRRELENNSSDSESFTGKYDIFSSVDGIGAGVWSLRF